jgi:hypothetical protein
MEKIKKKRSAIRIDVNVVVKMAGLRKRAAFYKIMCRIHPLVYFMTSLLERFGSELIIIDAFTLDHDE